MTTHAATALPLVFVCLVTAGAGAGAPQGQPAQPPAFRAGTVAVEVDVMVTDDRGRFVEDLGPGDFELHEDDVAQKIQAVYVVRGGRVDALRPEASAPPGTGMPASPMATPPAAQRVLVLFFDLEHLDQSSFRQLQPAAARFFEAQFQPGDVGGVLLGSTMVGNRLTTSREDLLAAVKNAKPSFSATTRRLDQRDWPRMSDVEAIRIAVSSDSQMLRQVADRAAREAPQGRQPVDYTPTVLEKARYMVNRLQPAAASTLKALQGLTTGLARIPGRKTIVFMSEGFMFENAWGDLRVLVAQAARANVRIYTLDALGLRRRSPSTELGTLQPLETGAAIPSDIYNTVEEGPNTLALDTGGYVIRNTNDFAGALDEIARDTSHYYVLGYTPSNGMADGKFRRIGVRVKRPGVQVRARRGYVATPPVAPAPGAEKAPAPGIPAAANPASVDPPAAPDARAEAPATASTASAAGEAAAARAAAVSLRPDQSARVRALADRRPAAGSAKQLAAEGWERYGRGDLEGAEQYLDKAVGHPDSAPWVHYAGGFAKFGLGKPAEAVLAWEHVRSAAPDFLPVYFDLADAYLQLDDPGRSIDALRAAEKRWPGNTEILNAIGTIQVRRGAVNDAIATFEQAIAQSPDETLAYFNAARTFELRYFQMRRFSRPGARWLDNPADLQKAIEYYGAYVGRGGPYVDDARAAIERLRSLR